MFIYFHTLGPRLCTRPVTPIVKKSRRNPYNPASPQFNLSNQSKQCRKTNPCSSKSKRPEPSQKQLIIYQKYLNAIEMQYPASDAVPNLDARSNFLIANNAQICKLRRYLIHLKEVKESMTAESSWCLVVLRIGCLPQPVLKLDNYNIEQSYDHERLTVRLRWFAAVTMISSPLICFRSEFQGHLTIL